MRDSIHGTNEKRVAQGGMPPASELNGNPRDSVGAVPPSRSTTRIGLTYLLLARCDQVVWLGFPIDVFVALPVS